MPYQIEEDIMRMRARLAGGTLLFLCSVVASPQTITFPDGTAGSPGIAIGDGRIGIVWQHGNIGQLEIRAAVLDFSGNVINQPFAVASSAYIPCVLVAAGERDFFVTWREGSQLDDTWLGPSKARAALFDDAGLTVSPFTIPSSSSPGPVAFDGTRFLAFQYGGGGTRAAWINKAGVVESMFPVLSRGYVSDALAQTGTASTVWIRQPADSQAQGATIDLGMTFIEGTTPLRSTTITSMPAYAGGGTPFLSFASLAWNGDEYFVAWFAGRYGRTEEVEGTRVRADGVALDVVEADAYHGGGAILANQLGYHVNGSLHVFTVGRTFVVSWARINPLGDPIPALYLAPDGKPARTIALANPVPIQGLWPIRSGTGALLPDGTPVSLWITDKGNVVVQFVRGPRRRAARR